MIATELRGSVWTIEGKGSTAKNPYCGKRLTVTWLKPWGGKSSGYQVTGTLRTTFCVNGRTLIGELDAETPLGIRRVSAPWSHNWIRIEKGE